MWCFVWVLIPTVVLLVKVGKMSKIQVFRDGILIEDFMYPAFIPNDVVKLIKLVDDLPKITMKLNGYNGLKMWKGFFRLKEGGKRAVLYLENHNKGPFVEIRTTSDCYYINFKDAEHTTWLYEEIVSTMKLVDESRLACLPSISQKRSIIVVAVLVMVVILPQIFIAMFG